MQGRQARPWECGWGEVVSDGLFSVGRLLRAKYSSLAVVQTLAGLRLPCLVSLATLSDG